MEMPNQAIIITLSLALGLASGFIMHRADFCMAGMFRDLFLFRSSPQLRSLILLVTVSMVLFEGARLMGILNYSFPSPLFGLPSLTTFIGGAMLGLGMVLAGGCVVGTLYKLGSGSTPAVLAFIGLIIGSAVYAEYHPLWKSLAGTTKLSEAATLQQLAGHQATIYIVIIALFLVLIRWQQKGLLIRPNIFKGYLQPRTAALSLAVIGLLSFSLTGMPLGITTSYSKFGAFFAQLAFPEHIASLGYFQGKGFSYFSPISGKVLSAGAGPFWDGLSLVQFPLISGIVIGAFASSIMLGKFQVRWDLPKVQFFSALIGGVLMGMASRMTPACNVWHLMGGLPLLSLQSLLFAIGLFPGAWLGTKILTRYVLK